MKLDIISKGLEKKGSIEMPAQFNEAVRVDVIRRAVEVEQSINRQPYGAAEDAGTRHSAVVSKRRRDYKGTYGIGQSRTPRKVVSRSGTRMNWVGAFAPQTVGGRQAHPPKPAKIWAKILNSKEKNFALRSAISATLSKEDIKSRGHNLPDKFPFVIDSSVESLKKTKDVVDLLLSIGLDKELIRSEVKKIRSGKGKSRGRKYKTKKGVLIVTSDDCALLKAAKNIPGIDVCRVSDLTVEQLAPGAVPGRLTLWTNTTIDKMNKEKIFM